MAKDATNHSTATQRATSEPPDRPTGPLAVPVSQTDRDVVKVNNSNVTELKNACDDAVKRYLGRAELFTQIHLHTDVRLGLGWLSVFVAGGTALYGYKVDFEKSKPVVWFGVIMYFLLTSIQTLYAYFVEGDTVFVGRRKTFSKRIITERITLSSKTQPARQIKPSSANKNTTSTPPAYTLSISYVRSTNAGKSLLAKGKTKVEKGYTAFFDEQGTMDQEAFEKWVGEAVESAMDAVSSSRKYPIFANGPFASLPTTASALGMTRLDTLHRDITRHCSSLPQRYKRYVDEIAPKSKELRDVMEKALQLASVEPHEREDRIAIVLENIWDRTKRWAETPHQPHLLGNTVDLKPEITTFLKDLNWAKDLFTLEADITLAATRIEKKRASEVDRRMHEVLRLGSDSGFTSRHFSGLEGEELQSLSDFADLSLRDLALYEDLKLRTNATLSMLCKLATCGVYPRAYELKGVCCREREADLVGLGGSATVYKGLYDGRDVCVKVFRLAVNTKRKDIHEYYKELTVWAHLNHPNILNFYGVCRSMKPDGKPSKLSVVSPWMEKGNLADFAKTLEPGDRLPLLYDVILGLAYLHDLGIVHGDLKGNNVLVSNEIRALITDFGSSHIQPLQLSKAGLTSSQIVFTLRWVAPEVLFSPGGRKDTRPGMPSDIWAFGCLCGETLSGMMPYEHLPLSDPNIVLAIEKQEYPFIRPGLGEKNYDPTTGWMWEMISGCLTHSAVDRPTSDGIKNLVAGKLNIQARRPLRTGLDPPQVSSEAILDLQVVEGALIRVQRNIRDSEASASTSTNVFSTESGSIDDKPSHDEDLQNVLEQYKTLSHLHRTQPIKLEFSKFKKLDVCKQGPFSDTIKMKYKRMLLAVRYIHSSSLISPYLTELMQQTVLSHPNILPFYGVLEAGTGKQFALLTPWIENGNIADYSSARDLAMAVRLRFVIGLTDGLRYLHDRGITHGALKPENILVSESETALISDICIGRIAVKALEAELEDNVETDAARWLPRELCVLSQSDHPQMTTSATKGDIWSLGGLMLKVLTGKNPYHRCKNNREVFAAHKRGEAPTHNLPRPLRVDERIWTLKNMCWNVAPNLRPTSGEILEKLRSLSSPEKISHPQQTSYPDARKFHRKEYEADIDFKIVVSAVSSLRGNRVIPKTLVG
ncbi:hypothetical protein NP233_g4151 [Leucocoprinus birnbaumii]|uniref:Signal peptidase complex subunit 2 n=1 Tax=Leucocoprinus birnbaumii TaxID=56174 RepID=A0AAD5VWM2_9AGAR|nr:hypothetical protein NP233_g4151 [Leucocoprinus birnbaumii]